MRDGGRFLPRQHPFTPTSPPHPGTSVRGLGVTDTSIFITEKGPPSTGVVPALNSDVVSVNGRVDWGRQDRGPRWER